MNDTYRTWAEISMANLDHNYHAIRSLLPYGTKFFALVKANAYGHGAVPVARRYQELGADYLGVATVGEAIELRENGITMPILVLGVTPAELTHDLAVNNISQCCTSLEYARQLSEQMSKEEGSLTIHIQCDTGMTRLGFLCDDAHRAQSAAEILEAVKLPGLKAEGIVTHFSDSGECEEYTMMQFERFLDIIKLVEEGGYKFELRHCANSAAVLLYPAMYLDMVRPGIILYGHVADEGLDMGLCDLKPVMALKTRVSVVREVPAGTPVSYGRTYTLERDSRLAVLPIGYADGFSRRFSSNMTVKICGKPAPIVGRVCMDMCMADVTDIPEAAAGCEVILYGNDESGEMPVEAACDAAGTIPNELLSVLTARVTRVYV